MKFFTTILLLAIAACPVMAQHPVAIATRGDFAMVKANLTKGGLLQQTYQDMKKSVDPWLNRAVDVPVPKDPAGGYTHERHKANYMLMYHSGLLYQLTGDVRYASLVKQVLVKYASLNPTLTNHPEATSSSPGRIFWQALNDANWLVYTGIAFDLVHNYLTEAERRQIAEGAFRPEVDYITKDLKSWFDLIHNHAVWACAGVGLVGIATNNNEYLQMALYGSDKNGKAGLLAQLNGLFSPDGYYTEGPYYTRYALLPFYLFANGVNNVQPSLKIFEHRNGILQKALDGALQQTNLNGAFYTYNDAIKDKTYVTSELVTAIGIAWQVYGPHTAWLPVAKAQNRVILSRGGAALSAALQNTKAIPNMYPYATVEYTDGPQGDEGGVSVLRSGKDKNLTSLIFKYSAHGMSHGHFDKLNIHLFDNGNEVLQDYGAVRYVGIEQKYGGRYLPETKGYAMQSIAHNTLVADEKSHYNGKEQESEKHHPVKLYGKAGAGAVQVVSAADSTAYNGITLHRSIFMIELPGALKPLVVDVYRALSGATHQYDLPFHYLGTAIGTNFKYTSAATQQQTLGKANGYQYLWKEAEAVVRGPLAQFTYLNGGTFYTISSAIGDSATALFARIGANDPNFNMRREPAYILRKTQANCTFVNVVEIHGIYSAEGEVASSAYPSVSAIETLRNDDDFTVAAITIQGKRLLVAQANKNHGAGARHTVELNGQTINWTGPWYVVYDGKALK